MTPKKVSAWSLIASLLLACLISACQENVEGPIPQDVLPRDSMVLMLTDIHLVEGARVGTRIIGDTLPVQVYYKKVYSKFDVTKERFDRSFDYYSSNPDTMRQIYEEVVENLNKIQVNPPRESLEEPEGQDSTVSE